MARLIAFPPALHYPIYRRYFPGLVSMAASYQAFQIAQFWLIYELTGSALYLGYVGLANSVPNIVLNLLGGVFADRLNKRYLLAITTAMSATLMVVLAIVTLLDLVRVWHVLVIGFMFGAVNAFDNPARNAIYPHVMERKAMTSGIALDSSVWSGTRIIAPALAGILIDFAGTATAIFVSGASMALSTLIMLSLRTWPVKLGHPSDSAKQMLEGMYFIRNNPTVAFLLITAAYVALFGASYFVLMPVFAVDVLGVTAQGLGILLSSAAAGGILISVWIGALGTIPNRGAVLIGSTALAGLLLIAFGLTSQLFASYPLAVILMFAIGAFSSLALITNTTSLHLLIPDHMRGRVTGVFAISYTLPALGAMPIGAIATSIGAPMAIAIAGLAVTLFAVGPALLNSNIRNLSKLIARVE